MSISRVADIQLIDPIIDAPIIAFVLKRMIEENCPYLLSEIRIEQQRLGILTRTPADRSKVCNEYIQAKLRLSVHIPKEESLFYIQIDDLLKNALIRKELIKWKCLYSIINIYANELSLFVESKESDKFKDKVVMRIHANGSKLDEYEGWINGSTGQGFPVIAYLNPKTSPQSFCDVLCKVVHPHALTSVKQVYIPESDPFYNHFREGFDFVQIPEDALTKFIEYRKERELIIASELANRGIIGFFDRQKGPAHIVADYQRDLTPEKVKFLASELKRDRVQFVMKFAIPRLSAGVEITVDDLINLRINWQPKMALCR